MNLNAEYAGNVLRARQERELPASSSTQSRATAPPWVLRRPAPTVGKRTISCGASASRRAIAHRFYASLVVVMVLGVILLFVAVPSKWLEGCQVCTKYEARTVYRDGRAKQRRCAPSRAPDHRKSAGGRRCGSRSSLESCLRIRRLDRAHRLRFRLKTRVFQPAGLIGTTLARSVL